MLPLLLLLPTLKLLVTATINPPNENASGNKEKCVYFIHQLFSFLFHRFLLRALKAAGDGTLCSMALAFIFGFAPSQNAFLFSRADHIPVPPEARQGGARGPVILRVP